MRGQQLAVGSLRSKQLVVIAILTLTDQCKAGGETRACSNPSRTAQTEGNIDQDI